MTGLSVITCLVVNVASVGLAQSIVGSYGFHEARGIVELIIEQADDTLTGYMGELFDESNRIPLKGIRITENHWQGHMETEVQRVQFEIFVVAEGLDLQINDGQNAVARVFYPLDNNPFFSQANSQIDDTPLLLEMLSYVPDNSEIRENYSRIRYGHFWRISEQNARQFEPVTIRSQNIAEIIGVRNVSERLSRLVLAWGFIDYLTVLYEDMPEAVGFSFFDIQAAASVYSPPNTITILKTIIDRNDVGTALNNRGFEEIAIDSIPVWQRFEDDAVSIRDRNQGDPFGGNFGQAARIAFFPEIIVNSSSTAVTTQSIEAAKGRRPSLADAPDIQALVNVSSTLGEITQATFLSPTDVKINLTQQLGMATEAAKNDLQALPFYDLSMVADFADRDGETRHAWAVLYNHHEEAEIAAEEGKRRLEQFSSIVHEPSAYENLHFESQVIQHGNFYVSLIAAEYATPAPTRGYGKWLFKSWITGLYSHDFFPAYVPQP